MLQNDFLHTHPECIRKLANRRRLPSSETAGEEIGSTAKHRIAMQEDKRQIRSMRNSS